MKLIAIYEDPLSGTDRFFPRDIRNYIASIVKQDKEVHEEIMGHHRRQPTFIFSMPNRKSFGIYTFKTDAKSREMIQIIHRRIEENRTLRIGGIKATVEKAFVAPYEFTQFKTGLFERRLRTPLVIASQEFEYAICRKFSNGEVDMNALKKYTAEKIRETVTLMARDWYGEKRAEEVREIMDDATILFKDLAYTPIKYKEKEYYPAVRGTIISDVELPLFIGYKSGMGYGELSSLKEMDRRNGKRRKA